MNLRSILVEDVDGNVTLLQRIKELVSYQKYLALFVYMRLNLILLAFLLCFPRKVRSYLGHPNIILW